MKTLFKTLCAIIFFVLIIGNLQAEESKHLKKGDWALSYGTTLKDFAFNNNVLGVQYLFADRMGVWAWVTFNSTTGKPTENSKDTTYNSVGFDIGYIYHFFQKGNISAYVSPQIGFSNVVSENENNSAKSTSQLFSVGTTIGAEWFVVDNFSLSINTYIGFVSTKTTTETTTVPSSKVESTNSSFGMFKLPSSQVIFSFYF